MVVEMIFSQKIDVFPPQGKHMGQQALVDRAGSLQEFDGLRQIDGIPDTDRINQDVQCAGTMELIVQDPFTKFLVFPEENRAGQGMHGLPLVQSFVNVWSHHDV